MWRAFDLLEPIGDTRMDLGFGIVASTLANVNRDEKKRPEPFTPVDFMPFAEKPKPKSVAQQIRAALKNFTGKKG